MTDPAKDKKPTIRKLLGGKLKRAEHERMVYRIKPDDGTTLEDIMKQEYWAHVGKQLRTMDIIEVVFQDGSRYVELLVVDSGPLWAKVAVKADIDLTAKKVEAAEAREQAAEDAPYKVEYRGPNDKWCVIRKSDGEKIEKGFASKEDANTHLDSFQKAMAA